MFSQNKAFLIFQEIETPKKFVIFQKTETLKDLINFPSSKMKKKKTHSEKTSYISGNGTL